MSLISYGSSGRGRFARLRPLSVRPSTTLLSSMSSKIHPSGSPKERLEKRASAKITMSSKARAQRNRVVSWRGRMMPSVKAFPRVTGRCSKSMWVGDLKKAMPRSADEPLIPRVLRDEVLHDKCSRQQNRCPNTKSNRGVSHIMIAFETTSHRLSSLKLRLHGSLPHQAPNGVFGRLQIFENQGRDSRPFFSTVFFHRSSANIEFRN